MRRNYIDMLNIHSTNTPNNNVVCSYVYTLEYVLLLENDQRSFPTLSIPKTLSDYYGHENVAPNLAQNQPY